MRSEIQILMLWQPFGDKRRVQTSLCVPSFIWPDLAVGVWRAVQEAVVCQRGADCMRAVLTCSHPRKCLCAFVSAHCADNWGQARAPWAVWHEKRVGFCLASALKKTRSMQARTQYGSAGKLLLSRPALNLKGPRKRAKGVRELRVTRPGQRARVWQGLVIAARGSTELWHFGALDAR